MSAIRTIKKEMDVYAKKYPILVLTGPRQSGKTTFLKTQFSNYQYVNLENIDNRNFALNDPNGFLKEYNQFVIFDEVQRVPELFSYLQTKVDEDKIMGQYILSGSQNFHLMQSITQSLAGRVALFKLLPFDFSEMKATNWLNEDYAVNLQKGFYPAIYDRTIPSKVFYSNYVQTYVERDLLELIHVKDLKLFRNFISLCAARVGQLLNLNSLANECGISQPTAKSWISVLETSYIMYQLQPYHSNFNKRITKSSKLYFYDTGLACSLLGIRSVEQLQTHFLRGSLFENLIINELTKNKLNRGEKPSFYFWRDSTGHEIDLLSDEGMTHRAVEIKSGQTIRSAFFDGLNFYTGLPHETETVKQYLIYGGNESQKRTQATVMTWQTLADFG